MSESWVRYSNLDVTPESFRKLVESKVPHQKADLYRSSERLGRKILRLAAQHGVRMEIIFDSGVMAASIENKDFLNLKKKSYEQRY